MDLSDVVRKGKEGEVYKATFAIDKHWYISKSVGSFWYCDKNGDIFQDIPAVPLT